MSKEKIEEFGFYDLFEVSGGLFDRGLRFELNYERLPLAKICADFQKVLEQDKVQLPQKLLQAPL